MGLICVRGVLCVGTLLLFGTRLLSLRIFSCCDFLSLEMAFLLLNTVCAVFWVRYSWAWAWCCSFGLLLCFVRSFSGIDDYGDVAFVLGRELPFLWLILSLFGMRCWGA